MGLGWVWSRAWAPWRRGTFPWQVWHVAASTFVSRGRRGTWRHLPSFHVAGVALGDIDLRFAWQAWQLWDWAGSGRALGRRGAVALCVAGVALGAIYLRFIWQAWYLATSTFVSHGRRGTNGTGLGLVARLGAGRRGNYGTGLGLVARLGAAAPRHFRVAGMALGDILRFLWQAWHSWAWAGSGRALGRRGAAALLRCKRGT